MKILFFDTETTGKTNWKAPASDPSQPHIIQFGGIIADENQKEYTKISCLIKPMESYPIEPQATEAHGITDEQCEKYGIHHEEFANLFLSMIHDIDLIVCHNVNFDKLVIQTLFSRLLLPDPLRGRETFCTMEAYTPICQLPGKCGYKWPKLQEAYEFVFKEKFEGAHDALNDIIPTMKLYFKFRQSADCVD